jgi:hypothetical protein
VRAAVGANRPDLAQQLLNPVAEAPAGIVSPAVAAHLLNLKGVVGALRGDDPTQVEADLGAGMVALAEFGAIGLSARAEEDLGRWLVDQGIDIDRPMLECLTGRYKHQLSIGCAAKTNQDPDRRQAIQIGR